MNNYRYTAHVGYPNICETLFSRETLSIISNLIERNLSDIDSGLSVSMDDIKDVLNAQYESYRLPYGFPLNLYPTRIHDPIEDLVNQTVDIITRQVRNDHDLRQNASRLTAWTTVMGTLGNEHCIRAHSAIKLNDKKPRSMQFNMPL